MKIGLGTSLSANGYPGGYVMPTPNLKLHHDGSIPSSVSIATGVDQWDDLSGNGNHSLQAVGLDQPSYDPATGGVTFDGIRQFMKTAAFTLNQPETVYLVGRQVTWTNVDRIWDGDANNSMGLFQDGATPQVTMVAGLQVSNTDFSVGADHVIAAVYNSASSSLKVDNNPADTGNASTANGSGFHLGTNGNETVFGNIIAYEVAIYSVAHDATTQAAIINGLMNKWTI